MSRARFYIAKFEIAHSMIHRDFKGVSCQLTHDFGMQREPVDPPPRLSGWFPRWGTTRLAGWRHLELTPTRLAGESVTV